MIGLFRRLSFKAGGSRDGLKAARVAIARRIQMQRVLRIALVLAALPLVAVFAPPPRTPAMTTAE